MSNYDCCNIIRKNKENTEILFNGFFPESFITLIKNNEFIMSYNGIYYPVTRSEIVANFGYYEYYSLALPYNNIFKQNIKNIFISFYTGKKYNTDIILTIYIYALINPLLITSTNTNDAIFSTTIILKANTSFVNKLQQIKLLFPATSYIFVLVVSNTSFSPNYNTFLNVVIN